MRSWALHIIFASILVGSLAVRVRVGDVLNESGDLEHTVVRVARSQGLVFERYASSSDTNLRALVFAAPGCSRPVLITLLHGAFDQDLNSDTVDGQGGMLHYVYIDRTWAKPNPLAFFVERTKFAALAMLGLTQYLPSWHLLRIESWPHCEVADTIDWRQVWDRPNLADRSSHE